MIKFISHGIYSWMDNNNTMPFLTPPPTDRFYFLLSTAYQQQTAIDWDHFLQGRITFTWGDAHDNYISIRHISNCYHSTKVMPSLLLHIFDFGQKMWQNRNDIMHDSSPAAKKRTFTSHLNLKIENAYADKNLITREQDRQLLFH